jgi:dihydrofolate synthase/folylpolyglutamate synthase
LGTALAFSYFAEEKVDFAIIEVGIGGKLDSTNVITPVVSAIATIGLEP